MITVEFIFNAKLLHKLSYKTTTIVIIYTNITRKSFKQGLITTKTGP